MFNPVEERKESVCARVGLYGSGDGSNAGRGRGFSEEGPGRTGRIAQEAKEEKAKREKKVRFLKIETHRGGDRNFGSVCQPVSRRPLRRCEEKRYIGESTLKAQEYTKGRET